MWERIKQFFVPCEANTYHPHFLGRFSMGVMLLLVVCTFMLSNVQALLWRYSDWMVSTILPAVIVDLTNRERGEASHGALTRNATLDAAATLKAEHMAQNEYFAHYSPDGVSPWHWFEEAGYAYVHAGENLAVHFADSGEVVEAWMQSPTHRKNIMNDEYTEIGIGTARGTYKGASTIFVVQLFGTPAPQAPVSTAVQAPAAPEQPLALAPESSTLSAEVLAESTDGGAVLSVFERNATQPSRLAHFIYIFLGSIIALALVFSIIVEWRRKNPLQIAYAGGLLVIMVVLFHIHIALVGGVAII